MKIILSISVTLILFVPSLLLAENYCGNIENSAWQVGPYDYNDPEKRKEQLARVEHHHFSKEVERLQQGITSTLGADISFVLRVFPNHPRALAAMSRLVIRDKVHKAERSKYSALCYFDRAIRFTPNDALVRSLFGSHLLKIGKHDLALEQLLIASELEPDNPTFNYNLGLLYFDKKEYTRAREYAEKAYSLEFPLPGLRNKLQNVGKW